MGVVRTLVELSSAKFQIKKIKVSRPTLDFWHDLSILYRFFTAFPVRKYDVGSFIFN